MDIKLKEISIIILLAAGILLCGCSAPPAKTTPEDSVSDLTTAGVENPDSPTASPTTEIILADPVTPLPDTETSIPPTSTPLPEVDTPVPATQVPTQAAPVLTDEPSPTPTPSPTEAPDSAALLDGLQIQLVFAVGGGGGGLPAPECTAARQEYTGALPAVLFGKPNRFDDRTGYLCLAGLDLQSGLQVTITGRDGSRVSYAEFEIGATSDLGAGLVETFPIENPWSGQLYRPDGEPVLIQLRIWLPPGISAETWQVVAQSADWQISGQIEVGWPEDKPALYFPEPGYDPFAPPSDRVYMLLEGESELARLEPGQTLTLNGKNLPANQALPLALYQRREGFEVLGTSELTGADLINTDSQGEFQYPLSIGDWLPPGLYHLTIVTDPAVDSTDAGPYVGIYADTCPGAPDSDLLKGDTVEVNPDLSDPRKIRDQPGRNGKPVGEFTPGETAQILRNFQCVNQTVWWNVQTAHGAKGWVAEGQGEERYIVPAE